MPRFYGVKDLGSVADWQANANAAHWVRGHSAYELAHSWASCDRFPPRVKAALQPLSRELVPQYGIVEMPTFLDTPKAPSRTDLMLYCRTAADEPAVIGVEGKSAGRLTNLSTSGFGLVAWSLRRRVRAGSTSCLSCLGRRFLRICSLGISLSTARRRPFQSASFAVLPSALSSFTRSAAPLLKIGRTSKRSLVCSA